MLFIINAITGSINHLRQHRHIYGETHKKAEEMLIFSLQEWFNYLKKLSTAKLQNELSELGWKKAGIFNKQYSRSFVDTGKLQNMNAEDNKVERLSLIAA